MTTSELDWVSRGLGVASGLDYVCVCVCVGCALAELRVYQRQKLLSDQHLSHMQERLDCVHKQYGLCTQHLNSIQQHM